MKNRSFGRRSFDESVQKIGRSVKKHKFWFLITSCVALSFVLFISPSNRKNKYISKSIPLTTKQENKTFNIPSLILKKEKLAPANKIIKNTSRPIKILNFSNNLEIPPGVETKAVLLSGGTNGLIKAKIIESLRASGTTIFPSDTQILGYGRSSEDRLYIEFKKAILKDGKVVGISAQAFDGKDSILGLNGSRVGDISLKIAASAGLNFISGMALGFQDYSGQPRAKDAALSGLSQAATEQAKSSMEEIKNRQPTIEVKKGTVFTITFDGNKNE
ncbi:MAG: TrbI/VirB10 family protein [Oligoflexia bacterium]|nr:TrbI/VirB10 family protein [Oligoflexia bacterium]